MWKHLALAGLLAAATAAPAIADTTPRGAWRTIGFKDVGRGVDKDSISLPGSRRYVAIRLCAVRRPITMYDFTVGFANGEYQKLPVRSTIRPNQCTRAIDFYGRRHNIDRVYLTYERIRDRGTPVVYVQAR